MKPTAICLLLVCLMIWNRVEAQTVSLSFNQSPIDSVFNAIQNQSKFTFFYKPGWLELARPVTIHVEDYPLLEAVELIFSNQDFTFVLSGRIFTIVSKNDAPQNFPSPPLLITGKITGDNDMPLRANIQVQGTSTGTTADSNGYFKLNAPVKNAVLSISHIGYQPVIVKAEAGQPLLNISMEVEPRSLDEVVKKGYTISSRRNNLGTVTRITTEEIGRQPVNNFLAALEGRTPGVTIVQNGGLPGAEFSVQIRGQRSIGTSPFSLPPNSPLFIIDGVPFLSSSETLIQRTNLSAYSPFSTIDPSDIESIEILKDANSTSIYGSFGANGVVLITTKKPKYGKTSVDLNMYTGIGKITRAPDYMNTQQYLQMRREAFANDGAIMSDANAYDLLRWDTTRYTNWKDLLIGGTSHLSNLHLRISGGTQKTNFTASAGYNRESTVFPLDFGKTLVSFSIQLTHTSDDDKFELSIISSYGNDRSRLPFRDITEDIKLTPNAPSPFNIDGTLKFSENGIPFANPFTSLYQPTNFTMERLTTSTRVSYKIFPWLQAKTNMGYSTITGNQESFFPIASQDSATNPTAYATYGNSRNVTWIVEPQIELNRNLFYKAKLKILAGTSFREQSGRSDLTNAYGYPNDYYMESRQNPASLVYATDKKIYRISSAYGLINFNWNRKYMIEATWRRDGSSRFGPEKQFASFGSIAGGWIFSNEKFIQQLFPFISYGKLRASYGTTGNDQIGDYQFLDVWVSTLVPFPVSSFKPSRLYNNDYSWELHKSFDLGFDLGLFDDRIMLSAIWNKSRTGNQLIGVTLPTQTGFSSILENFDALVQNSNIEAELSTSNINNKQFKWKTSFNISLPKNKLVKFPGLASSNYGAAYNIGSPLNLAWRYRVAGVDPATGIYRILDKNNNVIDMTNQLPSLEDLVPVATYNPRFYGGLQNSFQIGNWQIELLFQFVKQKGLNQIAFGSTSAGFIPINQTLDLLQHWQKPGETSMYQQYTQSVISPAYLAAYFYEMSDATVSDNSFIRLKNASVSYKLPGKWMRRASATDCSLYVQGQNLATFTSCKSYDPENVTINPTGLPPLKIFTIGIHASF